MRNSVFLSCPAILNAKQRSIFRPGMQRWFDETSNREFWSALTMGSTHGWHCKTIFDTLAGWRSSVSVNWKYAQAYSLEPRLSASALAVTSAWTQLEAGLAIAAGLPVLALAEPGIHEGVFDPTTWGYRIIGHELSNRPSDAVLDMFLMAISRKQHAPFVSSNGRSV